jgi:3-oxoacyl-[acyl-carrier-protein] synthase III
MTSNISLAGLTYELGSMRDVAQLGRELSGGDIETLCALGLSQYATSELDVIELAERVVRRCLDSLALAPSEIDAVIFASDSITDGVHAGMKQLLCGLHMDRAIPFGVSFADCGNFHAALRTGAALLRAEQLGKVLVLTADRCAQHELRSRIVTPGIGVFSDGASCCVLRHDDLGEFALLQTKQIADWTMMSHDPGSAPNEYFKASAQGIKTLVSQVLQGAPPGAPPKKVFFNNYNLSVLRSLSSLCGFTSEQMFTRNVSRTAHVYASDNLINLRDYATSEDVLPGEQFLLLGTGRSVWGATLVAAL